ncbi:MAG: protein translocase subunit SecF [Acidimicrobiia bacterium]|nr:protein translocase subunit SecF [Acidimicrobiia bacterium]
MSVLSRLYRNETTFDFVGRKRIGFTISAILLTLSVGSLLVRGLNLGVDFEGGTVIEVTNESNATVADVRDVLRPFGLEAATVQLTSGGSEGIRVQAEIIEDPQVEESVVTAVAEVAGVAANDASVTAVGPAFGEEITRSAVRALVIFLIVVALFIAWRFEWKMALAGLTALFHDLLLTAGVYSITAFEVTPSTVVAILTILGYSLYDTVVVFDKIVETVQISEGRRSLDQIINDSMNTVLMRSLNTSLTSLLPVGSLLFIGSFLLGATTLREFALALFVGVAAGTYSSIFVASPLLATWKASEPEWAELEEKAAPAVPARPDTPPATKKKAKEQSPERPPAPASGPKPRPPKKGKRKRR